MRYALLFCLILSLAACASAGNSRLKAMPQSDLLAQLKEGETTKAQVESMLGSANSISFTDSGNEIWTYSYSKATPRATNFIPYASIIQSGANVKTTELVILFDNNGVVRKRTMHDANTVFTKGLIVN